MKKEIITNDENIKNLKKRKILRYILIVFYFATIVLALADLFYQRTILLLATIILFLITMSLNKYRESIKIIKHDELEDVRKAIEDNNKKYKKEIVKEEPKKEEKKEVVKKTPAKKSTTKKTTTKKTTTKKSTSKKKSK